MSAFGSILKYCINRASIGTMSSGHRDWEMSVKGGSAILQHNCLLLKDCCLRVVDHSYSQAMFHHMDVQWMSRGRPLDRWTGQDCGTSLVSEGRMSNGCPMDVHWTGGLDRTVGQAWSVRVGCPMDVPWMSIGQVDWTGQWDKPGL